MIDNKEHQEIDLLRYWTIIIKRRWLIIITASIVFLFAAIFTFTATPMYKATTRLLIEEDSSKMLSFEDAFGYTRQIPDETVFNTQLNLLKSRTLAERVARELDLLSRPELGAGRKPRRNLMTTLKNIILLKWIKLNKKAKEMGTNSHTPSNPYSGVAHGISSSLEVKPIRDTKLVDVSFVSPYPVLAAEIVNMHAKQFIEFSIEKRSATTQQASNFLAEVISDLNARIASKNQEMQTFGSEKDIPMVSEKENSALKIFEEYESAHAQAMIDLTKAQIRYQTLKDLDLESPTTTIDDPVIQQIQSDLRKNKNEYNEQRKLLGVNHRRMLQLKAKIDDLESQLQEAYKEAVDAAEADYKRAQETERRLKRIRNQEAAKMGSTASRFQSLQIELANLTNQLDIYTQMKEEAEISSRLAGFSTSNISIVDPAEIPSGPISPNKKKNLLFAVLVGLFSGIGFCFLLEYLDNTVKSPEDVERLTGLPSLGVVPYLSPSGITKNGSRYFSKYRDFYSYGDDIPQSMEELEKIKNIELINHHHPKFFISEDYRTIRTSILLSNSSEPPKSLLITSALPKEGKTSTSANIAVSFSQLAERVLVVDSDLRKPRIHRIFGVKNVVGLSTYLIGKTSLNDVIRMSFIQNTWVLPSGPIPPNPAEILNSNKMKKMLDEAKNHFDIILLDSPPMLAAIDGVVLSSLVDAVVLVVRSCKTKNKSFLRAYEETQKAKANVIGVVFNELRLDHGKYYYRDHYHGGGYNLEE